jgi:hypothetical protein
MDSYNRDTLKDIKSTATWISAASTSPIRNS